MSSNKKKSTRSVIYFDHNATTIICKPAEDAYIKLLKCYNPSSDSKLSKPIRTLLEESSDKILSHCNVSTATHTAIFTSGATESNCYIIRACVKSYKKKLLEKGSTERPHVITSSVEHHSIMECLKDLEELGDIDVTYVTPTIYGNILAEDVKKEIRPGKTCLITIMFANNEIPIINNIAEVGLIAHENRIPMHSDCVQIFGKYKIDIIKNNLDAISASAHKFYGPKGVGLLIISNKLIEGYNLTAEINGSQQHNLRGGTENVPGIVSMVEALKWTFIHRSTKNQKLLLLRKYTLDKLKKYYRFRDFIDYSDEAVDKAPVELVSLGPPDKDKDFLLPNTILLSVAKNRGKPFCNIDLKQYLDSKNIVISIGSACLTSSDKASHTLSAIGAPPVIKRGVLRISFGDYNIKAEVDIFIRYLVEGIDKQCSDIQLEIDQYDDNNKEQDDEKDTKEKDTKEKDTKYNNREKPKSKMSISKDKSQKTKVRAKSKDKTKKIHKK
jgi:cysteine desulfurase